MNHDIVIIKLTREEAMACLIELEKTKKPYHWREQAAVKVAKAMGLQPMSWNTTVNFAKTKE